MYAKIKNSILSLVAIIALTAVPALPVAAAPTTPAAPASTDCGGSFLFPTWYKGICKVGSDGTVTIKSPNEMPGSSSGQKFGTWAMVIGMNIVSILLCVVGYASLIFIIYGGFKYMINGDNSSGTVAARKTITNAVIGLVLSIMSVAIVSFVASRIVQG
jgi:hypothetical protein